MGRFEYVLVVWPVCAVLVVVGNCIWAELCFEDSYLGEFVLYGPPVTLCVCYATMLSL